MLETIILLPQEEHLNFRSVYRSGNRDVIERLQIRKLHTWRYTHAHYDEVKKLNEFASAAFPF